MTFSMVMRTIPREGNYVKQTLDRLQEVAARYGHGAIPLHVNTNADVTPNENACQALEGANAVADWVLFFEDDIDFIDDFFGSVERWLADHASATIHYYPLGCNYSQCFGPDQQAWPYRVEAFYGTQGFVIRPSQIPSLVAYVRSQETPRGFDLALARWHRLVEPEQNFLLTPVPCFIDHIGDVSSLGCEVGHFAGFGGREYSYKGIARG